MNVSQTKRTLKGLPPRKSVLLESVHGVGKSQVVAQVAAELSKETGASFGFIDLRLSQKEVGDLIGMPRGMDRFTVKHRVFCNGIAAVEETLAVNVTIYDIPHWFPVDKDSRGILFLDELNRATREVQQAAFELALDYRLNFTELPAGWRVVSAINDDMDSYNVLSIDPALYDRFLKIKFKPTVEEWLDFAIQSGVHPAVVSYVSRFRNDLFPPEKMDAGVVYPSPRSWVSLSDTIKYMAENRQDPLKDLDYLLLLAKGYIGTAISVNFVEYLRTNFAVFRAEDILDNFSDSMKKKTAEFQAAECAFYNNEIVTFIKNNKLRLTENQGENLFRYYKAIPKEIAADFWAGFISTCKEEATRWYKNTAGVMEYTLSFLVRKIAVGEPDTRKKDYKECVSY